MSQKVISLDIEAIGLKPYKGTIWMVSITKGKKTTVYHDCFGLKKLPADVVKELEDPKVLKLVHNFGYDGPYIELNLGIKIRNVWDTMLNEIVIQGFVPSEQYSYLKPQHGAALEHMLPRYGFPKPNKSTRENFINRPKGTKFTPKEIAYAEDDTRYLAPIQYIQESVLTRDGLLEVALLENKTVEKVVEMRVNGIGFDSEFWKKYAKENKAEFERRLSILPKQVKNWNSPVQVKNYFSSIGVHMDSLKDKFKVYLQTGNKTLAQYLYARELHKSVTAYGMNFFTEGFVDADGRIRCGMSQIINTGRFSMNNPNLQQLPGKDIKNQQQQLAMKRVYAQLGERSVPQHRKGFVSKPGHSFVIGDFSGQEMGIMAAAAQEDLWIDALLRGDDIHGLTASILYGEQWTKAASKGCTFPKKCTCPGHLALREPTKILNFMLAYGGGAQRLSEDTGMPLLEAKVLVNKYRKVVLNITYWLKKNGESGEATGVSYSADPYRRRRVLKGEEDWELVNQGKNNPVQSAGANMLKLAMISVPEKYPMVLVIHDEIILEVPDKIAKEAATVLKKVMEDSASYITGIKGLIKVEPRIAKNLFK